MRKLLFVLLALPLFTKAQIFQDNPLYGMSFNRIYAKTYQGIPDDTLTPPASQINRPAFGSKNGVLYIWDITLHYFVPVVGQRRQQVPLFIQNDTLKLGIVPPDKGGTGLGAPTIAGQLFRTIVGGYGTFTPTYLTIDSLKTQRGYRFADPLIQTGVDSLTITFDPDRNIYNADKVQGLDIKAALPTEDGQFFVYNDNYHRAEWKSLELGMSQTDADDTYLKIASNFNDLANIPTARSNLGATTIGSNYFTLANPGAITFPRQNADNSVSSLTAAAFRTAIGSTTLGDNLFTATNPGAITFLRVNADNSTSFLSAATFKTALGETTIGDAVFTSTNPSAVSFLRANADNSVTWRSPANVLLDLGGSTVGINTFTVANPGAIRYYKINADNTITLNTASAELSDLGGQPLLNGGTGFVKSSGGVISYDNSTYQPLDADLTTLAGLTATTNNFIVAQSSAWASVTPATVKSVLAYVLASSDFVNQGTTTTILHGNAAGNPTWGQIVNADVSASAAIVYSKLSLSGSIVNADIASGAAIAYSKLNLTGGIVNADISSSAAISISKLSANTFNIGNSSAILGNTISNIGGLTLTNANIYATKDSANFVIQNTTVTTKQVEFNVSGISAATTRVFTFPDISSTFAVTGNNLSVFSSTTSAQLAGVLSDETGGAGVAVFNSDPTFTTGITSDAYKLSTSGYNLQTGTTYTLVNSDNGKIITFNNASAITLTIPASLTAGFSCTVRQLGAGQVTFTASSTTLHNRQSFTKTAGQYALATIIYESSNTYTTGGDMQ